MAARRYFTEATLAFLADLAENNNRPWFEENRHRYERDVKTPALRFIGDFASHLARISPHFRADPRPVGGSLFRIHRDVRFSRDKRPYKTAAGIHFRHAQSKDAHTPGFYLHVEPGRAFAGVGIWHPDSATLATIRDAIVEDEEGWVRTVRGEPFGGRFTLTGESLTRPPRGYDPDHPLIEDLKRKDFTGLVELSDKDVTSPDFFEAFVEICEAGAPLNRFLCGALGIPY